MQLDIHTYPQGQQLSDGELVQRQVIQNGRLVFTDAYFGELSDGDRYIIPSQVEIPLVSDTEIIDFLVKNQSKIGWSIFDHSTDNTSSVYSFRKDDLSNLTEQKFYTGDTFRLLGAFREMVTELIHNEEL